MGKEFKTLSEKRKLECISTDGIHYYNYPEEDIKEFIKIISEKDEELMKEVKDFVFEHKPRNQDCGWDFTDCANFVLKEYDKRLRVKINKRAGSKLI